MTDGDARLDKVEEGLTRLGERMDNGFAEMDRRFVQVDERFAQVDERFAQVDERFAQVDERFGSLEAEVQKVRVLGEQNTADIKRIAEVQVHHGDTLAQHGAALQRIEEALEPLKVLPEAFRRVFGDHERRITALEEASRQSTPDV